MKTATLGGQTSSYSYDANGRRVKKVTPAETRYYYYDVNAVAVLEYTVYWETMNIHFNGKLVSEISLSNLPGSRTLRTRPHFSLYCQPLNLGAGERNSQTLAPNP